VWQNGGGLDLVGFGVCLFLSTTDGGFDWFDAFTDKYQSTRGIDVEIADPCVCEQQRAMNHGVVDDLSRPAS
jgi:hypothetical protein